MIAPPPTPSLLIDKPLTFRVCLESDHFCPSPLSLPETCLPALSFPRNPVHAATKGCLNMEIESFSFLLQTLPCVPWHLEEEPSSSPWSAQVAGPFSPLQPGSGDCSTLYLNHAGLPDSLGERKRHCYSIPVSCSCPPSQSSFHLGMVHSQAYRLSPLHYVRPRTLFLSLYCQHLTMFALQIPGCGPRSEEPTAGAVR